MVAEVDVPLPRGQRVGADTGERDHHLDVPGAVAQRREAELPADPGEDHPPRDAHDLAGGRVRGQRPVLGPYLADGGGPRVSHGIRVNTGFEHPGTLLQPDAYLLRNCGPG